MGVAAWQRIRGIALDAGSQYEFRRAILHLLVTWLGGDGGFLQQVVPQHEPPQRGVFEQLDPSDAERCYRGWSEYAADLAPLVRALPRAQNLVVDAHLADHRATTRTAFYADIVAPQRVRESMYGLVEGRGRSALGLWIVLRARRARPFSAAALARGRGALPLISICDGLLAKWSTVPRRRAEAPIAKLTPRERDVIDLLMLGYTNAEIALGLGTSAFTVRNQLAGIFRKAGVSTRAELASLAARSTDAP